MVLNLIDVSGVVWLPGELGIGIEGPQLGFGITSPTATRRLILGIGSLRLLET